MIIRPRPHWLRLLFVRRGSLIHRIYSQQIFIFVLSCAVALAHGHLFLWKVPLNATPFSLMGISFAIFMGFRINASYDRFWEARKHWGSLLVDARNLTRMALSATAPERDVRPFALGLVAFAATLRNQLRGLPANASTAHLLPPALQAQIADARSAPTLVLRWLGDWLQQARKQHLIDSLVAQTMEMGLNSLSFAQGSCERIANTPLPFAYTVVLHRSVYLFCILLPFGLVDSIGFMTPLAVCFVSYTFFALEALSDEIENPFGLEPNDLALDTMVDGIEASVRELLGDPPLPLRVPERTYLWT